MTAQYLKATGYSVDLKNGLGTIIMRQAQESGQLDVVWDYTGTALILYNKIDEKLDMDQSYQRVKELDAALNLIWLNPSELNNTYALAVPKKRADDEGLNTIEDLANKINQAHQQNPPQKYLIGVDFGFAARPDGLEPLMALYDFTLNRSEVKQMDSGLVYTALHNDQLHVGPTYSSDILHLTMQHLMLVGIAVGLAILIGVPLGIVMVQHCGLAGPMMGLATVILTLPSIALFGLMIPLFSRFGEGLGPLPAITAAFLYSLLPVERNTYIALDGIDSGIKEAGIGIGMTFW